MPAAKYSDDALVLPTPGGGGLASISRSCRVKLVFAIMAGLAEFESSLISERVKAGMERAKAEGKRTNRPPVDQKKIERMRELKAQGLSVRAIERERGVARSAVSRYTKGIEKAV